MGVSDLDGVMEIVGLLLGIRCYRNRVDCGIILEDFLSYMFWLQEPVSVEVYLNGVVIG